MVINEVSPVNELFDYYAWSTFLLLRVVVPASLLFLTQFNLYFYIIMPFIMVMQCVFINKTSEVYKGDQGCEKML